MDEKNDDNQSEILSVHISCAILYSVIFDDRLSSPGDCQDQSHHLGLPFVTNDEAEIRTQVPSGLISCFLTKRSYSSTKWLASARIYWNLSHTPFTRYKRLSIRLYNRFDNPQPVVNPVVKRVWQLVGCLYTRYNRLSRRFDNRFDNRLYRVSGASPFPHILTLPLSYSIKPKADCKLQPMR